MSREDDRERETRRFTTDTSKWSFKVGLICLILFLLVPIWDLLEWVIGLFV